GCYNSLSSLINGGPLMTLVRRASMPKLAAPAVALLLVVSASSALAQSPGGISFSDADYTVNEKVGQANIVLQRRGGRDGAVSAQLVLNYGTSSPADFYPIVKPGALDTSFDPAGTYDVISALRQKDGRVVIGGTFTY